MPFRFYWTAQKVNPINDSFLISFRLAAYRTDERAVVSENHYLEARKTPFDGFVTASDIQISVPAIEHFSFTRSIEAHHIGGCGR